MFVSDNVLNLSKRVLSQAEISLLSKGLKFVPTPRSFDRAALKLDLEKFGRKLRLKWFFRNDQRELPMILLNLSQSLTLRIRTLQLKFI